MKKNLVVFFLATLLSSLAAQDTSYARKTIKTLCSKKYYGRGYYKNGAVKAGDFIASEMKKAGLKKLSGKTKFTQSFSFPVNTIGQTSLSLMYGCFYYDLVPGIDYIVNADAGNENINIRDFTYINEEKIRDSAFREVLFNQLHYKFSELSNYFIDTLSSESRKKYKPLLSGILGGFCNTIELVNEKLTWTVSTEQLKPHYTGIDSKESASFHIKIQLNHPKRKIPFISGSPNWGHIIIKSKFKKTTQKNVLGYIPGTEKPDSFIIVTAHYDHLGMMGPKAIFPGANDNACGVAMMLDMAKYYSKNPPKYSMVFIAFAGEEAGLIGSQFYVQNPIVPLNKTRFVFNLDLVGTGEEGGTVVNASVFKKEWALLDSINKKNHYLPKLITRGKAANSDHYFFTEAGVPSFFIYLAGPRPAYHDVFDVPETLTLAGYNGTFRLIRDFMNGLQQ